MSRTLLCELIVLVTAYFN